MWRPSFAPAQAHLKSSGPIDWALYSSLWCVSDRRSSEHQAWGWAAVGDKSRGVLLLLRSPLCPPAMEALVCRKLGDPTGPMTEASPIVVAKSHPTPEIGSPTGVRVRVFSTSLNYANYLQILGKYQEKPPLPFIPGADFSGVVESVGSVVGKFKVGDRVCSIADLGSYAEMIVVDEKEL